MFPIQRYKFISTS